MIDIEELNRLRNLPNINLYDYQSLGLIIDYPAGITYCNQVGGYSVSHLRREGLFMPIPSTISINGNYTDANKQLFDHFFNKLGGNCYKGISESTADFIDNIFKSSSFCKQVNMKVNRNKLNQCMEAWIEVEFNFPKDKKWADIYPQIDSNTGILTWENSD